MILARKLNPYVFGIFALATILVDFARTIAAAGMYEMIVREPSIDDELADTAFWSGLGVSIFVGVLVALCAGPFARFVGQPAVAPVVRILAVFIPVTSLGAIHIARKIKEFGHKAVTLRIMTSSLLGGVFAVAGAYRGLGVWSFVVQVGVAEVAGVVLAWQAFKWLPGPRFSFRRLVSLLEFNANVILSQSLWILLVRVQELFIGRMAGTVAVGDYRVAWRMMEILRQAITAPVSSVALVTFSHLNHDTKQFVAAYRRMVSVIGILLIPAIVGYGALAPQIIYALFGSKWNHAAPIAQVLAFLVLPQIFNTFVAPALVARGDSRANTKASALQVALTIILAYFAAPYGVVAIAAAYVLRAYITMPYSQYLLRKQIGLKPFALLEDLWPPLAASICMAVTLVAGLSFLHRGFEHNTAYLALGIAAGGAIYCAGLFMFDRKLTLSHIEAIRSLFEPADERRRQFVSRNPPPSHP